MPKLICVKCQVEYKIKKTGNKVIETFNDNEPYRLWMADRWACPVCQNEIIAGFAKYPLAEHFEDDFEERLAVFEDDSHVVYDYEC